MDRQQLIQIRKFQIHVTLVEGIHSPKLAVCILKATFYFADFERQLQ